MRSKAQRIVFHKAQFDKAVESLSEAVHEKNVNQYVKDATIQRFEYTYETAWKLIKAVLSLKGINLIYPRDLFREAFTAGWIKNPELWEDMIEDRNLTSHTYQSRQAEEIYRRICGLYAKEFRHLQQSIEEVIVRDLPPS